MRRTLKISSLKPYQSPQINLLEQLPLRELAEMGWTVVWNEELGECDAWIVLDGLFRAERTRCPAENTLFVSAEPAAYKRYDEAWLGNFHRVVSCQKRITHPRLVHHNAPLPWFVRRSMEKLKSEGAPRKTAALSTVCSSRHNMLGHRRRLRCLKHLQRSLPGKIEWYGRKIRFIEDKWDGIAPFRFSLAIENSREAHYWTEKIADCFLSRTIPLYDGAPNISDYFPETSFIPINTDEPETVLRQVKALLADPIGNYERRRPALEEARRLCLEKHSFGARLKEWCTLFTPDSPRVDLLLSPEPSLPWWTGKVTKFRRRWLGTT